MIKDDFSKFTSAAQAFFDTVMPKARGKKGTDHTSPNAATVPALIKRGTSVISYGGKRFKVVVTEIK